jgi:hypothetical protein
MSTHTPGPWTALLDTPRYTAGIHYISIEAGDLFLVKTCGRSLEEAQANAHLIAAAPELLDAALNAVACAGHGTGSRQELADQIIEILRPSILKAQGA